MQFITKNNAYFSKKNLLLFKLNQILNTFCSFLQVYEEKEKMWERELRKIKGLYDNRLRASQQKSSKMEQALTNQTYQVSFAIPKKYIYIYESLWICQNVKLRQKLKLTGKIEVNTQN